MKGLYRKQIIKYIDMYDFSNPMYVLYILNENFTGEMIFFPILIQYYYRITNPKWFKLLK